jgi:hypothetical protein
MDNYPEYFLDYHEGRLTGAAREKLMAFLKAHPALREEFEAFEPVTLSPDQGLSFPLKGALKRGEVTTENYDWYFAAYVEGDLEQEEREAVEAFALTGERYARELSLMKKTLLEPDQAIVFPGKSALRRHSLVPEGVGVAEVAGGIAPAATSEGAAAASGNEAPGAAGPARVRRLVPLSGKVWYYGSAAAVMLLLAGLFFLRTPVDLPMEYAQDIPAVGPVEQPEAVAEASPPQQVPSLPGAVAGVDARQETPAVTRQSTVPSREPLVRPGQATAHDPLALRVSPAPLLASRLPVGRPAIPDLQQPATASISHRTEFAYWDVRRMPAELYQPDEGPGGITREVSLSQLALNRLQQSVPVDRQLAEERLSETRNTLASVAGSGRSAIGQIGSGLLDPEPLPGEEDRQMLFAIGSLFRVSRTASPE